VSTINPKLYSGFRPNNQSRTIKERFSLINIKQYILKTYRKITRPKIVDIEGVKISVSDHIQGHVLRTIHIGTYEQSELEIVKRNINTDDVVMELGTGIGLISSYCAQKIGSKKVFTYEANPNLEPHIRRNYKLNNVSPNLEMCILGENVGNKTFYVNKDFWASSTLHKESDEQAINVPVKSFNAEICKINPTFLIIDIEGGEYELFKYANLCNVKKICLELHNNLLDSEKTSFVLSKLGDSGFLIDDEFSFSGELFLTR
jgi:FkbM family methyltransferase